MSRRLPPPDWPEEQEHHNALQRLISGIPAWLLRLPPSQEMAAVQGKREATQGHPADTCSQKLHHHHLRLAEGIPPQDLEWAARVPALEHRSIPDQLPHRRQLAAAEKNLAR